MGKTWREQLEAKAREREERVNRLGQFCGIVAQDVVRLNIRQKAIEQALTEKGVLTQEAIPRLWSRSLESSRRNAQRVRLRRLLLLFRLLHLPLSDLSVGPGHWC